MHTRAIVSCILAITAHGLKMKGEALPPAIPQHLQWVLAVDGKDAEKGPHGYDGDGFEDTLSTLPFVLSNTEPLTPELAMRIHRSCCSALPWRTGGPMPMNGQYAACFTRMDCKDQEAALSGVPKEWTITTKGNQSGCLENIKSFIPARKRVPLLLQGIFAYYAWDTKKLVQQNASFDAKLDRMAQMLRQVAWLHAFRNFNGRFRTLLLQREIRYLGLGSGAAMYNNNRDVFFMGLNTYKAKILEGIEMLDLSLEYGANAWLNLTNVQRHRERFPATVTCNERTGSNERADGADCESWPAAECLA